MDNTTLSLNNLTEEEITQLKTLLDKINQTNNPNIPNKKQRWKPEKYENYWCIYPNYDICVKAWNNTTFSNDVYAAHNCFKTGEEAEFEVEKRKVYNELLTYAEEHNECEIDWGNREQIKWHIYYSSHDNKIHCADVYGMHIMTQIYFTSKEIARDAIKSVGEERIKKYLFGVE